MKKVYILSHKRKKFTSRSFSNYPKNKLLDEFYKSLVQKDLDRAYYFGFEILCSGYYDELWSSFYLFICEYVHILSCGLPKIIYKNYKIFQDLRKQMKIKKTNELQLSNYYDIQLMIGNIIKCLVRTQTNHISNFIDESYNNQTNLKFSVDVTKKLIVGFSRVIKQIVFNRKTFTKTNNNIISTLFDITAKLLCIDVDSIRDRDYQNNINLYNHKRSNVNDKIMKLVWREIFKHSSFSKDSTIQMKILFKIYYDRTIDNTGKKSFLLLNCILYFIHPYKIDLTDSIVLDESDFLSIKTIYRNMQDSLDDKEVRSDFIHIEPIQTKKKSPTIIESILRKKKIPKIKKVKTPPPTPEPEPEPTNDDNLFSGLFSILNEYHEKDTRKSKKIDKKITEDQLFFLDSLFDIVPDRAPIPERSDEDEIIKSITLTNTTVDVFKKHRTYNVITKLE